MGAWTAPAAAAAFAAGIALARGAGLRAAPGWCLLVLAAVGLGGVAALAARSRMVSGLALLRAAGLVADPDPPGARESILAAVREEATDAAGLAPAGRPPVRRAVGLVAAGLAATVLLGAGWEAVRSSGPDRSFVAGLGGESVRADVVVSSEPAAGAFGWSASATVEQVVSADGAWRLREPVWMEGQGGRPPFEPGDRVRLAARPERPGAGGFADYLRSRGIGAVLRVDQFDRVGGPSNPLLRAANAIRRSLRRAALSLLPSREAGLFLGLSLGDTSKLDPGVQESFRATGLGHLVAVSGENLAMFLAPLLGLAMALRLGRRGRFAVGMGGIVFFALLTRAEPSVLRAAAMAGLALFAMLLGKRGRAPSLMGSAVLLLLAWDPSLVFSLGFQLSVAATAGMAALAEPVAERIPGPRALALAAGATIGAQAGVTPLLLLRFHVVPTVTLPANILAFPAVAPAMLLGLVATSVSLVSPSFARPIASLAAWPLRYLIGVADRMGTAPFPSLTSGGGLPAFVFATAVVVGLALALRRHANGAERRAARLRREPRPPPTPRPARPARPPRPASVPMGTGRAVRLALVAIVLPAFVWVHAVRAGPPGSLEVRFFDVGQGDAALVRSPGGAAVLIDAGPEPDVVAAKLAAAGVHRIDIAVATHPHADHVTGFPTVFARFPVGLVLDPGCPGTAPQYADFLHAVHARGLTIRRPMPGEVITVADLRLQFFAPFHCYQGTRSDPNNDSIVMRVSVGTQAVLFTGDVEEPAQQEILQAGMRGMGAVVLKVPHHGGATSLPDFLYGLGARIAVVSVGQPNPYGHPAPSLITMLREGGMQVFRTDRSGDVVVRFGRDGPLVESARAA